jgi:cytochrome c556
MSKRTIAAMVLIGGLCIFPSAQSDQGDRVVKFRQATMTVQAETFAALSAMVTGKVPYDPNRARVLSDRALVLAQITSETFPVSSRNASDSRTRSEVWSEPQDFSRMMTEYLDKTAAVAAATKTGSPETVRAAVIEVGRVCRSCHERYESPF